MVIRAGILTAQGQLGADDNSLALFFCGGVHADRAVKTVAIAKRDRFELELQGTGDQFLGVGSTIKERKT
jgi:hypothetical protein